MATNSDLIKVINNCIWREQRRIENAKKTIDDAESEIIELKEELLNLGAELPIGE